MKGDAKIGNASAEWKERFQPQGTDGISVVFSAEELNARRDSPWSLQSIKKMDGEMVNAYLSGDHWSSSRRLGVPAGS